MSLLNYCVGRLAVWIAISVLFLSGCGSSKSTIRSFVGEYHEPPTKEQSEATKVVAQGSNRFGFALLKVLSEEEKDPNALISPASITLCSAMLMEGMRGPEQLRMKKAFGLEKLDDAQIADRCQWLTWSLLSDPEKPLMVANALWLVKDIAIKLDYANLIRERFEGEIGTSYGDIAKATLDINEWAKKNTAGMIPKIVERVDPQEILFLLNAVAFESFWEREFEERLQSKVRSREPMARPSRRLS